ncbi:uncharacterized protein LOC121406525 [Lytechinus variegatus]|uniref:uncharacterized protein LOC121406525 n=1 Tax=Lytechinus variegatus TaxID=7654 RepID=UPI001BB119EF|nr:uncharacterized protein LOC121406525 [Lytechinus variegatus]
MENRDLTQNPQENDNQPNHLADFVARNYEEQKEARRRVGDADEDQRVDAFLQRALSESKRMNAEVARAERRQNELYRELGQDKMHSWIMEHASEVTVTLPSDEGMAMETEEVSNPNEKADAIR